MQVTIQLEPEFVEKIDQLAESLGMPRSQVMRNLMKNGYDDAVILEKAGLFTAYRFGEKVVRKIKEGLMMGRYSLDEDGELKINYKDEQPSNASRSENLPRRRPNRIGRLV